MIERTMHRRLEPEIEFIRENQPHFAIGLEENLEPLNQLERRTDDLDEDNVNK